MTRRRYFFPLAAVLAVAALWLIAVPVTSGDAPRDAGKGQQPSVTADPALHGRHAITADRIDLKNPATGHGISADLYLPAADGGRFPLVFILHGFMHNKEGHREHARHLASWGFVVVVPDLTYGLVRQNNDERVNDLIFLYERIVAEQSRPGEPLSRADTTRLGLVGHSAGGLTALSMAARRAVQAVVGLDAVLTAGPPGALKLALDPISAATVDSPVLLMEAPPQSCNNQRDRGLSVFSALLSSRKLRLEVKGASHCDFTDSSRACNVFCRIEGDAGRRAIVRRYTVAWLRLHLAEDSAMARYVEGEDSARLAAEGRVTILDRAGGHDDDRDVPRAP